MTLSVAKKPRSPGAKQNFRISGAKTYKSLKKSRAARAMETIESLGKQDFAIDSGKSEDPAKMTHSISDFLSRHGAKR